MRAVTLTNETKHLKNGDENVPKKEGVLRLYSMKFCPFSERVRLVLLVKNVKHDIVNIDLKRKPEWFLKINPAGMVPALYDGSRLMTESLDLCEHLDKVYPEPRLKSTDPKVRQRDKYLLDQFDKLIPAYNGMLRDSNNKPVSVYISDLLPILDEFETELANRGNYFGGVKPGMVDYMIWPWAERVDVIELERHEKLNIPEGKLSHIQAWCARMKQLVVVKRAGITPQQAHKLYRLNQSGGLVDYDSI